MRARPAAARAATLAVALAAALPSAASAHAEMTPKVSLRGALQLYSLAVPTEKEGALTTKVVLTVPPGFGIDSFAPSPGWQRTVQQSGSGQNAVIQQVTWAGGHVPTGEDSVFQFLAQPAADKTYTFTVQQTYSDGQIITWNGPESSDTPAPTVEAKSSLGGGSGGFSTLSLIALIVGIVALLAAALALAGGRGGDGDGARPLA